MKTATSWYRLGLRGRLFMAFGIVAALTVLASGSAIVTYDSLGRSLGVVTEKSLPEITRASKVVRAAEEIGAAAPRLLAATDGAERENALKALTAARQELKQTIAALAAEDAANLNKTADRIFANLDRLMQSVTERQTIAAARGALVASLRKSHQKLAEKLAPMADDAGFSLTMGLQTAADNKDLEVIQKTLAALADNELASLQAILDLRAESNLILGILVEAADLPSADLLPPVRDRFNATAGRLAKAAATFKDADASKLVDELVKTGKDAGNVFDLKQKELVAAKAGAAVVTENVALARQFEKEVAGLGARSEASAAAAVRQSETEIRQGQIILICLALISLATALVIGWWYVGRGVVRRLVRLQHSMKSIAAGDLAAEVATNGSDEIAEMAGALQVFKDNMVESNRLRAERLETDKKVHAQRKAEMQRLADEFEAAVGEIVQTVSSASTELEASATMLTTTAEHTQQLSGKVEAASQEASSNVKSVAAATEEMTASIAEISQRVQEFEPDRQRSREPGRDHRCAHQRAVESRGADRRRRQPHHDDRGADQSAGAQCHDRGGARRRIRPGFCGGGAGSEGARRTDRQGDQRDQQPDCRDAGGDPGFGGRDQADRNDDRPDFGNLGIDCGFGRSARRRNAGHRPQRRSGVARHLGSRQQYRRREPGRARDRLGFRAGAVLRAGAVRGKQPPQA